MGIIGKTQGVINAARPPRKDRKNKMRRELFLPAGLPEESGEDGTNLAAVSLPELTDVLFESFFLIKSSVAGEGGI